MSKIPGSDDEVINIYPTKEVRILMYRHLGSDNWTWKEVRQSDGLLTAMGEVHSKDRDCAILMTGVAWQKHHFPMDAISTHGR